MKDFTITRILIIIREDLALETFLCVFMTLQGIFVKNDLN